MAIYLFDFDGTLVDSMPDYARAMVNILEKRNLSYPQDLMKIITPLGYRGTAEYFVNMGVDATAEEMIREMEEYALHAYTHTIPAKPHVKDTLERLAQRGDSLNILTASPHITLDACLDRLGLTQYFQSIWSCEDFRTTKADPQIYHMVADALGCDVQDIIFADDNFNAVRCAKSAGTATIGVYDASSAEYEQEIKAVADRYIYDFSEI